MMQSGKLFHHEFKNTRSAFTPEIKKLKMDHPKSFEKIDIALDSGLCSLFLRRPETAKAFAKMATMMSISANRDIQVLENTKTFRESQAMQHGIDCNLAAA